jgi:hypothetical protein
VLLSSPAAEAYGYSAASSCARYEDSSKQAVCQQLLDQLLQGSAGGLHLASDGAGGAQVRQAGDAASKLPTGLASQRYNNQGPDEEEEEEGEAPGYGYGGDKPGSEPHYRRESEGDLHHPRYYPHDPPTPSIPLTTEVFSAVDIALTPKTGSVDATGSLTQDAFSDWSECTPQAQ